MQPLYKDLYVVYETLDDVNLDGVDVGSVLSVCLHEEGGIFEHVDVEVVDVSEDGDKFQCKLIVTPSVLTTIEEEDILHTWLEDGHIQSVVSL